MPKNPRFEDEALGALRQPDLEKVWCRDCVWRAADRMGGSICGATLAVCQVYSMKPHDILWKNVRCPYYLSETDMDEETDGQESPSAGKEDVS